MFPVANATLTAVAGGGFTSDYDQTDAADTSRWSGAAKAYVNDELVEAVGPGSVDELRKRNIVIPSAIGALVQRGDTLTFTFDGSSQTGKAQDIIVDPLLGRARVVLETT